MTRHLGPIIALACLGAAACAVRPGGRDSELSHAPSWTAILIPADGGTVHGTANVISVENSRRARVVVSIDGSRRNALHPWEIHEGKCGDDGAIVGRSSMYPPIPIGGAGAATMSLELPIQLRARGDYYLNVHEGPSHRRTVACGGLLRDGVTPAVVTR